MAVEVPIDTSNRYWFVGNMDIDETGENGMMATNGGGSYIHESIKFPTQNCLYCIEVVSMTHNVGVECVLDNSSTTLYENPTQPTSTWLQMDESGKFGHNWAWMTSFFNNDCCVHCFTSCYKGCYNTCNTSATSGCGNSSCVSCAGNCMTDCASCVSCYPCVTCYNACTGCASCTSSCASSGT